MRLNFKGKTPKSMHGDAKNWKVFKNKHFYYLYSKKVQKEFFFVHPPPTIFLIYRLKGYEREILFRVEERQLRKDVTLADAVIHTLFQSIIITIIL